MDLETSQTFKSSQHSVPSPDGSHVATIDNNRLYIRNVATLATVRAITLPSDRTGRYHSIRWSPVLKKAAIGHRILVADDDVARFWDLQDEKWSATIRNGSGGMGRIVSAEFGATGDEALLFSEFGARVTVWSLSSRRSVEIKDPKSINKGHGYRPKSAFFALLSRPSAQDIITLHSPSTYFVFKTINVPSADAQGLKWSPDGQWLAVWDTPSVGLRVFIFSADGHLYRTHAGELHDGIEGLGTRTLEWSPRGDFLAIGGHDKRVTLLSTRTFSPSVSLEHASSIEISGGEVWQEQVSATARTYVAAPQPVSPPALVAPSSDPTPKVGVSIIAFNADGSIVATRDDSAPTTLWLWDLNSFAPRTIVIQHNPIKNVLWHPNLPHLLLIQCLQDEQVLYLWDATTSTPTSIPVSFSKSQGRVDMSWIATAADKKPAVFLGDSHSCVIIWPDGRDVILRFDSPNGADEPEDSLYEILTGKKPVLAATERTMVLDDDDEDTATIDDTFMGKKGHMF